MAPGPGRCGLSMAPGQRSGGGGLGRGVPRRPDCVAVGGASWVLVVHEKMAGSQSRGKRTKQIGCLLFSPPQALAAVRPTLAAGAAKVSATWVQVQGELEGMLIK